MERPAHAGGGLTAVRSGCAHAISGRTVSGHAQMSSLPKLNDGTSRHSPPCSRQASSGGNELTPAGYFTPPFGRAAGAISGLLQ